MILESALQHHSTAKMIVATIKWKGGRQGHRTTENTVTLENLKCYYGREEGITELLLSSTHNQFQDASKAALRFSDLFN